MPIRGPAYFAANLDLALKFAPKCHRTKIPMTPAIVKPPSKLTPGPTPKLRNSGLEKWMAPAAIEDRAKSLPANRDAAYCG